LDDSALDGGLLSKDVQVVAVEEGSWAGRGSLSLEVIGCSPDPQHASRRTCQPKDQGTNTFRVQ
jgi:hypothetical protein